jgi:hypothetical protein
MNAVVAEVRPDKQKTKRLFWKIYGPLAAVLLVWPIGAMMAGFMFDAPLQGIVDAAFRYTIAYAIVFYPVLYFLAFFLSRRNRLRGGSTASIFLPAALPLIPVAFVGCLVLLGIVESFCT